MAKLEKTNSIDFKGIEDKVLQAIKANDGQIQEAREAIEAELRLADAAAKAMAAAIHDADPDGYARAKGTARDAKYAVEMHEKRIGQLTERACIPDEDALQIIDTVIAGLEKENARHEAEIVKRFEEILEITDDMSAAILRGNGILDAVQAKAMKSAKDYVLKPGAVNTYVPNPYARRFKDFSCAELGRMLRAHGMYKRHHKE